MNLIDSINISRYHKGQIEKYGPGSKGALGWKDALGQQARFEVLARVADLNGCSVLDAGCGHGDLCGFLNEQYRGIRYLGVDMEPAFLALAIERYGHLENTAFFEGDFTTADLPAADYILASGSLIYRSSHPEFIYDTITHLFGACRLGFAFNLLRSVVEPNGLLMPYDPELIVKHCRGLSKRVEFKEGYYEEDYTLMLYK